MSLNLTDDVQAIKGVGPRIADSLGKAGIFTVEDLLYYLPRTYENYQSSIPIRDIRPGRVMIRGKITDLKVINTNRRNFTITEGTIFDETDAIRVVWFNQPYRAKQFEPEREYIFSGMYDFSRGRYQLVSPQARLAKEIQANPDAGFRPIYRAKGQFKSENFEKIFQDIRSEFAFIPDVLPKEGAPKFVKPGARAEALFKVHFAEGPADVESGREYLSYEELFELLLAANLNKRANSKIKAISIPFNKDDIQSLIQKLPFPLTDSQRKATWEILQDLGKTTPMNRLLQGDVGSGKTVVAAIAAFAAIRQGHQVALLAPTAILAAQHAESLSELLAPFDISVGLLSGAVRNKEALKARIRAGGVDLVVGTHALITDDTQFSSLALCIIDEQHRFGVNQRQKLLSKTLRTDTAPHLLSMSATPIPRSLQLAIFGDLDVSSLKELPKGRQPITTKIITSLDFVDTLYPKVREYIAKGQQVYWICKTIEDSPRSESISVKKMADRLREIFPKANIEFLHGRLPSDEKDKIMADFASGKIDILVSTTVVEVGVNVPNANLMVIMNAEDYGLAQIHQLRGRVGRGKDAAECYLVSPENQPATKRLRELEKSSDGFYLAEVDLKIRGPGEIYGSLQHGVLDLSIANLSDTALVSAASAQAKEFAKTPDLLENYPELSSSIRKYQQLTTLN